MATGVCERAGDQRARAEARLVIFVVIKGLYNPHRRPLLPSGLLGVGTLCLLLALSLVLAPMSAPAQEDTREWPEANPADVKSPEAIIEAAFEAISDEDWDRFRSLHHPNFQSVFIVGPGRQEFDTRSGSIQAFMKAIADRDIDQRPVHIIKERYGDIAHVLVTFETRNASSGELVGRGVDSIQVLYDGTRWWILSVMSHPEREETPIPERYGG